MDGLEENEIGTSSKQQCQSRSEVRYELRWQEWKKKGGDGFKMHRVEAVKVSPVRSEKGKEKRGRKER